MLKVVFDMGNVLLDYDPKRFIAPYVTEEKDRQLILQELFHCPEWLGGDMGVMTFDEIEAIACSRLPERLHPAVHQILDTYAPAMYTKDGVKEMIETLLGAGFDLYILSNVGSKYSEMRPNIPHADEFKGEFQSWQVKMLKPDPAIYRKFCETYDLRPEECFFIDDSPANVFMARQVGMQSMVYRDDPENVVKTLLSTLA